MACGRTTTENLRWRDPLPAAPKLPLSPFTRDDFRLLVDSVADYAIFLLDTQGYVSTWNLGAERIKGYTSDEIIGQHFSKFYPPDEIAKLSPDEELVIAAREGRIELEGWRVRKDGTRFWANVVITALYQADGTLRGFGKVTRDLTERRAAEEELRRSEQRFRLLVDGVVDYAIYMLDANGIVTTWNAGAERIKGWTVDEIVGRHFSTFFPEQDVAAGRPERELAIARSQGHYEEEAWRVRKDGARFWAGVVLTALHGPSGELLGFAKVTRDLTARQQAEAIAQELVRQQTARAVAEENEAALRESNERYQALTRRLEVILEGIPDGVTVQDRAGKLLFANSAAARSSGFASASELLAAPPSEILTRFELRDDDGTPLDPSILPGRRALLGESPATLLVRVRDRQTGREWWSRIRSSAIAGSDGEPELAVNVWHDVTAERRREEQERYLADSATALASSLDYQAMLSTLASILVPGLGDWCAIHLLEGSELDPIVVAHVDPKMVARAREVQSRYPSDPNAPGGLWHSIRTGESQLIPEVTDEMLAAGAQDETHREALRELGVESVIIVPITIRGRVTGAITLISAHTTRRYDEQDLALAEELARRAGSAIENARLYDASQQATRSAELALGRAEEASRIKDEFLATISHELRTPLQSIIGWSTLLRDRVTEPSIAKGIEVIQRNATAQGKLIEDILDVSRVITGKLRLELAPSDLEAIVSDAIDVVRASALAKRISIEFEPVTDDARFVGDPERLQQVVWNLLSNAVKFTEPDGSVRIRLRREGSRLVLSVTDSGVGIEPSFLPYAFDRFKQADSSTTRRVGGLGLGLAIVRHIVELHGGQVSATSPGVGLGATFTISLPVRALSESPRPSAPAGQEVVDSPTERQRVSLSGVRVLVVDDEPDARELVGLALSDAGARIETAGSAREALKVIEGFRPHVLVSDVGMPEMDGYELMRQVRALEPKIGAIPAVALTAYTRTSDKMKAISAGFTMHVGKPVSPEELVAVVENLARFSPRRSGS